MIHDAFDELARLSLVRPSWDIPGTVRLVSPDIGLEYLLAKEQAEILRRQGQVESSRAAIATLISHLSAQPGSPEQSTDVSQFFELDAIRTKLAQLAYSARDQVLSLMPDGPQAGSRPRTCRRLDEILLRQGTEVRTIYLESIRTNTQSRKYVKWLLGNGGQVRTAAVLPLQLLVFDRSVAVVPAHPCQGEIGIAVMRGCGPVAAMGALFDQLWETATPFGEAGIPHSDISLSKQELAVVRLLAQGDTDDGVSRKLGVSPRTAGRLASGSWRN
jgi:hypothetical protein